MLLLAGAQPSSIKLSQGFLSSVDLRFELVGRSDALGCPGAVAMATGSTWHPQCCRFWKEVAVLLISPLLAWEW